MTTVPAIEERAPRSLLPWGGPLTYGDLEALRDAVDDGHRYELLDGLMIVSPSPGHPHQRAVGNLHLLLRAACPDELEVLLAPFDIVLTNADGVLDSALMPDLLVARRTDTGEQYLPVAPVLAVEVLSPSTRSYDLHLKKDRYRRGGFAHSWVVDPTTPSITAWHLVGDGEDATYELAGRAEGEETVDLTDPFPLSVGPPSLVDR